MQAFYKYAPVVRGAMPVLALLLVIYIFAVAGWYYQKGQFLSGQNAILILCDSATITVAALGMMLIIATGAIDLSAGAMLGLSTAVLAFILKASFDKETNTIPFLMPYVAVLAALCVGAMAGCFNGVLINVFRLTPFIVTLGTMAIFNGIALLLCNETTINARNAAPEWLQLLISKNAFKMGSWGGFSFPLIPLGIVLELVLAACFFVLLKRSVWGRHVLAVGSNEQAARLCGIRVPWLRIGVFTLAGALFGLAGVFQFARVMNYTPYTGSGKELDIIAAVVIGGGSLKGGRAPVIGTLVGSLLMATINSGCTQLQLNPPYKLLIMGCIILGAVLFDRLTTGRNE